MLEHLFPTNPVKRRIALAVFLVHVLFVVGALLSSLFVSAKPKHKPLIVKTVISPSTAVKTVGVIETGRSPPVQAQKAVTVKPQGELKVESKPAVKKAPPIADKTLAKNPRPTIKGAPSDNRGKISDALIRQLEESISKIDGKQAKLASKKAVTVLPLQIDQIGNGTGTGRQEYSDSLIQYLHESLHLPEFGEVKIQLTLRQDGTVVKLVVLQTESQKNKSYLERELPQLRFPPLEEAVAPKSFVLTFCNEI